MIQLSCGEALAGPDIVTFQVRKIFENLRFTRSVSQHFENILDANSHASKARATAALFRVERNAIDKVHGVMLLLPDKLRKATSNAENKTPQPVLRRAEA